MTPSGLPGLDPNLDGKTRQAVIAALTSVSDPAQLQGFAASIAADFPVSAALLWSKAAALVAQHPAPIAQPAADSTLPGPAAPAVQVPPPGLSWRMASNADVARDGAQSVYQRLLSQPVGTQIQQMLNGRPWQFRVISKLTDPGLTKYDRDVKGWIGSPPGQLAPAPGPFASAPRPAGPMPIAMAPHPTAAVPAHFAPTPAHVPPITTNKQVQAGLNALGYHGADGRLLVDDGGIGPNSQAAVRKFQSDHGLTVDGIPGPVTRGALAAALAAMGLGVAA